MERVFVMLFLDGFEVEYGSLNFLKVEFICCLVILLNFIVENMIVIIILVFCNVNFERNKRLVRIG